MQRGLRSSTSKCEVFVWRYGCQQENICHCALIANRSTMNRCCHFHRSRPSTALKIRNQLCEHVVQLVSTNFKGASKLLSYLKYLKFRLYHVRDARRRDLEILEGLALNVTIINQCSKTLQDPIATLPEDVVDGNGCSVTVLSRSILKASLFVMVVLRSM